MPLTQPQSHASHRPYGAEISSPNFFPGFRYTSPWAIFDSSLREARNPRNIFCNRK